MKKLTNFLFQSSYQLNIPKSYAQKMFSMSWVFVATLLLFYQSHGLTLKDLLILKSVLSVIVFVTELPSGYFADVVGRKNSIVISNLLFCISLLTFSIASSFSLFLVAEILLGLAVSLMSGADTALVYDSLKAIKKEGEFRKIEGIASGIAGYSEALGGLIGGLLASYNLVYPFYFQLFLMFLALLLSLTLKEPKREEKGLDKGNRFKELFVIFKESVFINKKLSKLILVGALLGCTTFFTVWHAQAYLDFINIKPLYFGFFWAFFHVVLGVSSNLSNYFSKFFNYYKATSVPLNFD